MNNEDYITILQEWIMQFGLYEVTFCATLLLTIWRLPNIIHAVTEYRKVKHINDSKN